MVTKERPQNRARFFKPVSVIIIRSVQNDIISDNGDDVCTRLRFKIKDNLNENQAIKSHNEISH